MCCCASLATTSGSTAIVSVAQDAVIKAGQQGEANLAYLASLGFALSMDHVETLAMDFEKLKNLGFRHVKRGDWVVRGEDGECYIVDDAFFQRTFTPLQTYPWENNQEARNYGC